MWVWIPVSGLGNSFIWLYNFYWSKNWFDVAMGLTSYATCDKENDEFEGWNCRTGIDEKFNKLKFEVLILRWTYPIENHNFRESFKK